jgi:hypothetical protein
LKGCWKMKICILSALWAAGIRFPNPRTKWTSETILATLRRRWKLRELLGSTYVLKRSGPA